jgi:hypothetical protein
MKNTKPDSPAPIPEIASPNAPDPVRWLVRHGRGRRSGRKTKKISPLGRTLALLCSFTALLVIGSFRESYLVVCRRCGDQGVGRSVFYVWFVPVFTSGDDPSGPSEPQWAHKWRMATEPTRRWVFTGETLENTAKVLPGSPRASSASLPGRPSGPSSLDPWGAGP